MTNGAWSAARDAAGRDASATAYEYIWEPLLAPVNRRLIDALRLEQGDRVISLAAGTGTAALAAAYTVGDHGHVLGIESSPRMVARARAKADGMNLKQVEFQAADPEQMRLPSAGYDGGFCGLDLAFQTNPAGVLEVLRNALKEGKRVAVAVPGASDRFPLLGLLAGALASGLPEARRALLLDPFALAAEGALRGLVEQAGFQSVEVRSASFPAEFGSVEEYVDTVIAAVGRTAAVLEASEPGAGEAVRTALTAAAEPFRLPRRGMRMTNEFLYAVGLR